MCFALFVVKSKNLAEVWLFVLGVSHTETLL